MRKRVGDPYETVGIIGSFRKHVEGINEAWEVFTKAGFEVLAPREPIKPIDPNVDFVILESDTSDDPLKLEAAYWGD